ncbi:MAG: hypothetical protein AABM42_02405 [Actinomycetota bacterium]
MDEPERVNGNRGRAAVLSALTAAVIGFAAAGCGDDSPEEQATQPKAEVVAQADDGAAQAAGIPSSDAHGSPSDDVATEELATAEQQPADDGEPGLASRPGGTADIKPDSEGDAGTTSGPGSTTGVKPRKPGKPPKGHRDPAPADDSDPGHPSQYDGRSDPGQGREYDGPHDP